MEDEEDEDEDSDNEYKESVKETHSKFHDIDVLNSLLMIENLVDMNFSVNRKNGYTIVKTLIGEIQKKESLTKFFAMDDQIKEKKSETDLNSNKGEKKLNKNKSKDNKSNGVLSNGDLKSNYSRNNKMNSKELNNSQNILKTADLDKEIKVEIKNLNNSNLEELFGKRTSLIHGADTKTDFYNTKSIELNDQDPNHTLNSIHINDQYYPNNNIKYTNVMEDIRSL